MLKPNIELKQNLNRLRLLPLVCFQVQPIYKHKVPEIDQMNSLLKNIKILIKNKK